MKLRAGGNYTMEALALVSALCIVGIFVFSHFNRQMESFDQKAHRVAKAVPAVVSSLFEKDPQAKLTPDALRQAGLDWQAPMAVEVPQDRETKETWQVKVWHPEGVDIYSVSQKGVNASLR